MSADRPAFISLFSGAGGFDLGLERAGWRCAYAADLDAAAVQTLEANRGQMLNRTTEAFAGTIIERTDIRQTDANTMLAKIGVSRGVIPLLVGGPPCQSWSSAGHQQGFADPRGRLFDDFVRVARGLGVRWLLLESRSGKLLSRMSRM